MAHLFALLLVVSSIIISDRGGAQTAKEFQLWSSVSVSGQVRANLPSPMLWLDVQGRRGADTTVVIFRPGLGFQFSASLIPPIRPDG